MPDWVTHIAIALLILELYPVQKKSLVLVGAILPDLLPKLVLLRLLVPIPPFDYHFLSAFHTPFVLLLVVMLMAPLFRYDYWKVVGWITVGTTSHFLSDALLQHFVGGVNLFYPVLLKHYALNLVWPEQSYLILIPTAVLYLIVVLYKKYWRTEAHAARTA